GAAEASRPSPRVHWSRALTWRCEAKLRCQPVVLESPSGMGETPRLQAKPSGGPKGPGFFPWLYRARRAFVGFSRRGAQNPSPSGEGDSIPIRSIAKADRSYYTLTHGHGQTAQHAATDDVDRHHGSAPKRRASVLSASESHA